jgi:predicted adenylyl cyclase CyaB
MKEIEVKILEVNVPHVVAQLEKMGAKKTFDGMLDGGKFDFPDGRLKKEGKMLRLRKRGEQTELTFKKGLTQEIAKIAEELEVSVSSFEITEMILHEIGMQKNASVKKHRFSYQLGTIHFDFDTLEGIPTLLEIEASDVESLEAMVKKLGFTMDQTKPWTGKQVHEYYKKHPLK